MAFYELTKSVRIVGALPNDSRYVVDLLVDKETFISNNEAFDGLQVYVSGDTSEKNGLYILTDTLTSTWTKINFGGDTIDSNPTEIIFNSGGTLSGSSNLIYDYDNKIFKVSDTKSTFSVRPSTYYNPTLTLESDFIDGLDITVSNNNALYSGILESTRSFGSILAKTNITTGTLFTYSHNGYFDQAVNSAITGCEININAKEWSLNSYTTEYIISTITSGDSALSEKFKITENGNIKFNDSYIFPSVVGLDNQVLITDASGILSWSDMSADSTLSALTDTTINNPQEGDKLIYSGGTWVNTVDADTVFTENISSGGTYEFIVGNSAETNAIFIHFLNHDTTTQFQMGELQLLHNGNDAQVTTNGQDLDLYVTYDARLDGSDIYLICEVPTSVIGDVTMKYTLEIF